MLKIPVIAEGGIWSPGQLHDVMRIPGIHAAVVGSAITRPMEITRRYVETIGEKRKDIVAARNLLEKIKAEYDGFTKREKHVADFVLAQPGEVLSLTISDLAARCGVGHTTVFRFCRSLKLAG